MKTCHRPFHLLIRLVYITLVSVLEAQRIKVLPEVTGYLGEDVTLPCNFIQGQTLDNITQVQWNVLSPGNRTTLIVFNSAYGLDIHESPLKGRLEIEGESLIIKSVEKTDAGSYVCSISAFPSGSHEGTTKLIVQEKMQSAAGIVPAVVVVVVLLFVIMAAIAYLMYIRRRNSLVRHRVFIDTTGPERDVARPSVIIREEDVVYSDVKLKPSKEASPASRSKDRDTEHADDVTYSEVVVSRQLPK
ncbi:nectin-4-like [Mugil cephalus]|uniref:nectin-4-like n=1 Tax=Mugil cephalus TaxID=48193 RepID=UPI001FB593E2|nr:nectin-4-like [Mugil cephalus]